MLVTLDWLPLHSVREKSFFSQPQMGFYSLYAEAVKRISKMDGECSLCKAFVGILQEHTIESQNSLG